MIIMDHSQLFFYIYEYKFVWCENLDITTADIKNYRLTYLGKILVVLKKPWVISKRINFLPYYPDPRNSLIAGTQIIPEYDSPAKIQMVFKNSNPDDT